MLPCCRNKPGEIIVQYLEIFLGGVSQMKKLLLGLLTLTILVYIIGCTPTSGNTPNGKNETKATPQEISTEEKQRMDLYIEVMKAAFHEENGGNEFVAVKLDTLDGLSGQAKEEVINALNDLSPHVYSFEDVRNDNTKFELDDGGRLRRTIDGALLWIEVEEYNGSKATITGVSWFGNLGAVFPKYEATYENGIWRLKLIKMAVS